MLLYRTGIPGRCPGPICPCPFGARSSRRHAAGNVRGIAARPFVVGLAALACVLAGRISAQQGDGEVRRLIESLADSNPGKRVETLRQLTDYGNKAVAAVST